MSDPIPAGGPRPTAPGERHLFFDLLRGAALLGIALVNVQLMSVPYEIAHGELRLWTDPLNTSVQGVVRFLFESTAFALFSLLFGAGFQRLMQRRAEHPGAGLGTYGRRIAALAVLGIAHVVLLWFGDVLLLYAGGGVVLLAFRKCRERTLWAWAGGCLVLPLVALSGFAALWQGAMAADAQGSAEAWIEAYNAAAWESGQAYIEAYRHGTFGEIVSARLSEYGFALWTLPFFGPQIFAAMLIGVALERRGVLAEPERHGRFFKRMFWMALPVAVVGKGIYAATLNDIGVIPDAGAFASIAGAVWGGMAMALVYVGAMRVVRVRGWAPRLVGHVAAAGRMALTHYLAQSLIATTLFFSYGLGWYGRINTWQAVALMIAVYGLQIGVSTWWFRRFTYGPLEALVRRFSYGRSRPPVAPPPLPSPMPPCA